MLKIGYVGSWRQEFKDLILALKNSGQNVKVVELRSNRSVVRNDFDVVFVSDTQNVSIDKNGPVVIRVFWNGADEVLEAINGLSANNHELVLTFFTDVAKELENAVRVLQVPFAFSRGTLFRTKAGRRIGYIGEVDISSSCFNGYTKLTSDLAIESVRSISLEVLKGGVTYSQALIGCPSEFLEVPGLENRWKWSLQNWIRWRMISLLFESFPQEMHLRGNDWKKVGLSAKRTRFSSTLRNYEYSRNAISVDFGSKSTSNFLYPRVSEIVANRGGLVQICLSDSSTHIEELDERRFNSGDDLVALVERRFAQDRDYWEQSDLLLQKKFELIKSSAVSKLLEICDEFKDNRPF